jgi:hypothetical protein
MTKIKISQDGGQFYLEESAAGFAAGSTIADYGDTCDMDTAIWFRARFKRWCAENDLEPEFVGP